jgi:hypothetical protein
MKSIDVQCPNCKGKYLANSFNTRFEGPYMRSECPNCKEEYYGKFLTFLVKQEYQETEDEIDRFEACRRMIDLARVMEKKLNPEPRKPKKKE